MAKKTILITGASGFIGRHLVSALLTSEIIQHYNVRCLVHKRSINNVECVMGNLQDLRSLNGAMKDVSIVIHIAAIINARRIGQYMQVNIKGTKNLITAARNNSVERFIYISSYDAMMPENDGYAKSKRGAEKVVMSSGIQYIILRPTAVYGKDDNGYFATLFNMVRKFAIVLIPGDGLYKLQPIYVDDVAQAIKCSIYSEKLNKTYVIAGPEQLTFREIINRVANAFGKKVVKVYVPLPLLKVVLMLYVVIMPNSSITYEKLLFKIRTKTCDISEARSDLGFNPVSFNVGLKKSLVPYTL